MRSLRTHCFNAMGAGILHPMTKDVLLMLLGGFTAFLPFLGFPNSWDMIMFVILGMSVVFVGIAVRRSSRLRPEERGRPAQQPYVQ